MRKAHEAEVQKEVTKFKTEFLKKIQSNHDIGALHKEHECVLHDPSDTQHGRYLLMTMCILNFRAEMEEIKKEILSLSDKYSIKCVESANLEEELKSANSQLAQAQQQIIQLDSRYCYRRPVKFPADICHRCFVSFNFSFTAFTKMFRR